MKKIFSSFIAIILVCLPSIALGADFRNVNWGMTKEEVVAIENQKEFKGSFGHKVPDNMLIYNNQKAGEFNCQLQYTFQDNKLVIAQYIFMNEMEKQKITLNPLRHTNTPAEVYEKAWTKSYNNYIKLKDLLITKYSYPSEDIQKWANETWKSVGGSIPYHIAKGHLIVNAKWDVGDSVIFLSCESSNQSIVEVLVNRLCYYETEYYKATIPKEPTKEDLKNL
jgi:hypothetical protein